MTDPASRLPPEFDGAERMREAHVHRWLLRTLAPAVGQPGPCSARSIVRYSCECGARKSAVVASQLVRQTVEMRRARPSP